ncbi:hypothetical protein CRG98_011992 [Punica granatum]|uniref:Uncharacterized protein n=1 Tax=Punica granatum TaxID=22663 RepID=A0A2I0KGH9_PUNGR|nr:hypothetical protein CRG98_011992 [Punica granatum]
MEYIASGYKERVGEGFESRVTRWNPWKDVRVHGQHVRASWDARLDVHEHAQAREGAQAHGWTRGQAREVVVRAGRAWGGTGARCAGRTGAGAYGDECRNTRGSSQAGASARGQTRMSITERLDVGAVTGVLFTREHDSNLK